MKKKVTAKHIASLPVTSLGLHYQNPGEGSYPSSTFEVHFFLMWSQSSHEQRLLKTGTRGEITTCYASNIVLMIMMASFNTITVHHKYVQHQVEREKSWASKEKALMALVRTSSMNKERNEQERQRMKGEHAMTKTGKCARS